MQNLKRDVGRVRVIVNGEEREIAEGLTLNRLLEELELAPERIAVELNRKVIRRADWPQTVLREGDRIEIVHFVGGGFGGKLSARRLFDLDRSS